MSRSKKQQSAATESRKPGGGVLFVGNQMSQQETSRTLPCVPFCPLFLYHVPYHNTVGRQQFVY